MGKFVKYFILATGIALFATLVRIPGTNINVHAQAGVCSVASLRGTYVFHRTGVNNDIGGPIAEMGIDVINGAGTRGIIRDTRSGNGVIQDWTDSPWPSGSYTVDPDCTGSFFDAGGTKTQNVVVIDEGKRFLVLGVAPDTITTGEGIRLEE
jgi:hypothetical protein